MNLLTIEHLTKSYTERLLFNDASFSLQEGEKVGVETPLCKQVVEMVHGIENGLYEIDYRNVDFFEA